MQPASQPAALYATFAINSNAINSTDLHHGQPASQPATRAVTAATVGLHARISFKNVIFGNDNPFRHKNPVDVLHMVCTRLCTKFRHRTTRRFGGDQALDKINKLSNI